MELSAFIQAFAGKANTGDTAQNRGQCVGLISVWFDEFGLPHIWGNAKDLGANADRSAYDVYPNTPSFVPQPGDVFYTDGSWGGGYGHTGIVTKADVNTFQAFEQNNPVGSAPRLVTHLNYQGMAGFIRSKSLNSAPVTNQGTNEVVVNQENRKLLYNVLLNRDPEPSIGDSWLGHDFYEAFSLIAGSPERAQVVAAQQANAAAVVTLSNQVGDLTAQAKSQQEQIDALHKPAPSQPNTTPPAQEVVPAPLTSPPVSFLATTTGKALLRVAGVLVGLVAAKVPAVAGIVNDPTIASVLGSALGLTIGSAISDAKNPNVPNSVK